MQLGRNRIEALTDGVFAVAMTLLVLDIKVPELQQPLATAELPLKLVALWPKFLSYTISFVILLASLSWECIGSGTTFNFRSSDERTDLYFGLTFYFFFGWLLCPFPLRY